MLFFIKRIIIYAMCMLIYLMVHPVNNAIIIELLVSMIASGLISIIFDNVFIHKNHAKYMSELLIIMYCINCLFIREGMFFIPVFFYEIIMYKMWCSLFACSITLVLSLFINPFSSFVLYILGMVNLVFGYNDFQISMLKAKMHNLSDETSENMENSKKNVEQLIERQDTEIYNATLRERNRIARDIHDNVGHLLTRAILLTGSIKVINKDDKLKSTLDGLHETLNTAMTTMRNSVHDLYDESLDLELVLRGLVDEVNDSEHLKCILKYDCDRVIPKSYKYAFIAVCKEAINNARKYSEASLITITVQEQPGFYQLHIQDNGKGMDENTSGGIGINNIKSRISEIGGTVAITSNKGVSIRATVMKND